MKMLKKFAFSFVAATVLFALGATASADDVVVDKTTGAESATTFELADGGNDCYSNDCSPCDSVGIDPCGPVCSTPCAPICQPTVCCEPICAPRRGCFGKRGWGGRGACCAPCSTSYCVVDACCNPCATVCCSTVCYQPARKHCRGGRRFGRRGCGGGYGYAYNYCGYDYGCGSNYGGWGATGYGCGSGYGYGFGGSNYGGFGGYGGGCGCF